MDASTGVRFHSGEVVISAAHRLVLIPTLGLTIGQLLVYEAVFLPIVLLQHSNVRLPRWLDYGLLAVTVTPAMHRVHHSRRRIETDSNYGSVFPYWDYLFRTMCLRSDVRHIQLGLDEVDELHSQTIRGMFLSPRECGPRGSEFSRQRRVS
jgi:sterol desaturase/sphingolipid hydroxylase (fatty acid hydroxylase superfamily)